MYQPSDIANADSIPNVYTAQYWVGDARPDIFIEMKLGNEGQTFIQNILEILGTEGLSRCVSSLTMQTLLEKLSRPLQLLSQKPAHCFQFQH